MPSGLTVVVVAMEGATITGSSRVIEDNVFIFEVSWCLRCSLLENPVLEFEVDCWHDPLASQSRFLIS